MNTCKYDIVSTILGNLTIIFTNKGICRIDIGSKYPDFAGNTQKTARITDTSGVYIAELVPNWKRQLESYFQGQPITFDIPLDIKDESTFRKKVWCALQSIPYGETRSYRWVAKQVGNAHASRAVGQANAANPIPILIPCHRVIRSDGSLGGFSSGVHIKKELLRLEGSINIA